MYKASSVHIIQWNLRIVDTFGTSHFVLYREVFSLWRLKCTSIIEKGPQSVSFIERLFSLLKLKCTSIIEKGLEVCPVVLSLEVKMY